MKFEYTGENNSMFEDYDNKIDNIKEKKNRLGLFGSIKNKLTDLSEEWVRRDNIYKEKQVLQKQIDSSIHILLDNFTFNDIKKLAYDRGIELIYKTARTVFYGKNNNKMKTITTTNHKNIDMLKQEIFKIVDWKFIYNYAHINNIRLINLSDILLNDLKENIEKSIIKQLELDKLLKDKNYRLPTENHNHLNKIAEIINEINKYNAPRNFNNEESYQMSLFSWLQHSFPHAKIETAIGHTRPDITIDAVAIEVKGPTSGIELSTLADKAIRYKEHWHSIIMVLFDIQDENKYNEWYSTFRKYHNDVIIIRK